MAGLNLFRASSFPSSYKGPRFKRVHRVAMATQMPFSLCVCVAHRKVPCPVLALPSKWWVHEVKRASGSLLLFKQRSIGQWWDNSWDILSPFGSTLILRLDFVWVALDSLFLYAKLYRTTFFPLPLYDNYPVDIFILNCNFEA